MSKQSMQQRWRRASLGLFGAAALTACGGGGGGEAPAPPAACPASASAQALQNPRLIARLRVAAPAAGKQSAATSAAAAPALHGLRMLSVARFESAGVVKAANTSAAGPGPLHIATYEITQQGMSMADAMQRLRDSGTVEYVELDSQQHKRLLPNDAYFGQAWHLKNAGQFQGYVVGNDIGAELAWNRGVGTGSTVVALIDDGVALDHPDLRDNLWRNPREIPGNGLDDDGNGIVDDVHGADLVLGTGDVRPYFPRLGSDHGTTVAGVLAARGNNGEGSSGVLWNTQLMALKIEGPPSSCHSLFVSDFVKALNYVVAQKRAGVNVRVVNISYGGVIDSQTYRDALIAAGNEGILVVVAAGNEGSSLVADLAYPSAWRLPNVLSVGSLTPANTRVALSNFGELVNIFAPGDDILSTSMFASYPQDINLVAPGYRWVAGTSFSAPVVAGAAALLMDTYPGSSTAAVRARLLATATPFGTPLPGTTQTKLNLGAAMATAP